MRRAVLLSVFSVLLGGCASNPAPIQDVGSAAPVKSFRTEPPAPSFPTSPSAVVDAAAAPEPGLKPLTGRPAIIAETLMDPARFEISPSTPAVELPEKDDGFFDRNKTTISGSISVAVGYEKTNYPKVSRIGRYTSTTFSGTIAGNP